MTSETETSNSPFSSHHLLIIEIVFHFIETFDRSAFELHDYP